MNPIDLSYAAGVIDSDGCIFVYVARRKDKPGNREYRACVNCAQAKPEAVKLLKKLFGGAINMTKPQKPTNFKKVPKPQFAWKVASIEARECIKALFPYLLIKKTVAFHALRFIALKEKTVYAGKRRTDKDRNRLDKLAAKISSLNSAKGKKRAS